MIKVIVEITASAEEDQTSLTCHYDGELASKDEDERRTEIYLGALVVEKVQKVLDEIQGIIGGHHFRPEDWN